MVFFTRNNMRHFMHIFSLKLLHIHIPPSVSYPVVFMCAHILLGWTGLASVLTCSIVCVLVNFRSLLRLPLAALSLGKHDMVL